MENDTIRIAILPNDSNQTRGSSTPIIQLSRPAKCGDKLMRHALYEAANSHMRISKRWSALRAWGVRLAKRIGSRKACVAVCPQTGDYHASDVVRGNGLPLRKFLLDYVEKVVILKRQSVPPRSSVDLGRTRRRRRNEHPSLLHRERDHVRRATQ
jgi:hypothetical protein